MMTEIPVEGENRRLHQLNGDMKVTIGYMAFSMNKTDREAVWHTNAQACEVVKCADKEAVWYTDTQADEVVKCTETGWVAQAWTWKDESKHIVLVFTGDWTKGAVTDMCNRLHARGKM